MEGGKNMLFFLNYYEGFFYSKIEFYQYQTSGE